MAAPRLPRPWWEFESPQQQQQPAPKPAQTGLPAPQLPRPWWESQPSAPTPTPTFTPPVAQLPTTQQYTPTPTIQEEKLLPWAVQTQWQPPADWDKGLWYDVFGKAQPEWMRGITNFADWLASGSEQRVKQWWEKPAERVALGEPEPLPSLRDRFMEAFQGQMQDPALLKKDPGERAAGILSGMGQATGIVTKPATHGWEQLTSTSPLATGVEQVLGGGLGILDEGAQLTKRLLGAGGIALNPEATGMPFEKTAPLAEVYASLAAQDIKHPFKEGLLTRGGGVGQALQRVKAGEDAKAVAMEIYNPIAELVVEFGLDPLNVFDILSVSRKLKGATEYRRSVQMMAAAAQGDPAAMKRLATWTRELKRVGNEDAAALLEAAGKMGVPDTPEMKGLAAVLQDPIEYINPLVPGAKAKRDASELWVVMSGPVSDAQNGQEVIDLMRRAAKGEDLSARWGKLFEGTSGKKARIILGSVLDEAASLPSAKGADFNPVYFLSQLDDLAFNKLKAAYGYKEPSRYLKFANAWKGFQSEFYLSAVFSPGYVSRQVASELFTAAFDGALTFEKRADIDKYLDDIGALTRRIEERGVGAKEGLTGIVEEIEGATGKVRIKSRLPWPLSAISEKGMEITRRGEIGGRLPVGEEARYSRNWYMHLKRFIKENALPRTPPLPPSVRAFVGTAADDLLAAVSQGLSRAQKEQAVKRFLQPRHPGDVIEVTKYLDRATADAMSPELLGMVREKLAGLPPGSTLEDGQRVVEDVRALADEDAAKRLADLQLLPIRKVATDTEADELIDLIGEELKDIARKAKDPALEAEAEKIVEELKAIDEEGRLARAEAVEAVKDIATPDALDIMHQAHYRATDARYQARKAIDAVMQETAEMYRAGAAPGSEIWPPYFQAKAQAELDLAHARSAIFREAQDDLRRLAAGESVQAILRADPKETARARLLAISTPKLPDELAGYAPGSVKDAAEAEKFRQFLEQQRGAEGVGQLRAWRAAFAAEPETYGDILDLLHSADQDVASLGTQTAGKVAKAREEIYAKAVKAASRHKDAKRGTQAFWHVYEDFYAIRNSLWKEYRAGAIDRWKIAERDVLMASFGRGRTVADVPIGPAAVPLQPGDEDLVRSAVRKADALRTPEEQAALNRWTRSGQELPTQAALPAAPPLAKPGPTPTAYARADWARDLRQTFKLPEKNAQAIERVTDAIAGAWATKYKRTPAEWYGETFGGKVRRGKAIDAKRADELTQLFQEGNAPMWYYKAERVIDAKMPNRANVEQVRAILTKGGVKADELQWSGVLDWLDEQPKGAKLSKQDVMGFLQENQVKVEEVVKESKSPYNYVGNEWQIAIDQAEAAGNWDEAERINRAWEGINEETGSTRGMPRFDRPDFVLPGAEPGTYRELLLTMPEKPVNLTLPDGYNIQALHGDPVADFTLVGPDGVGHRLNSRTLDDAQREALEITRPGVLDAGKYTSTHWPEDPNTLAHVRFNDRTGPNGERLVFMEEIQSDWHQTGREKGYTTPGLSQRIQEISRQEGEARLAWNRTPRGTPEREVARQKWEQLEAARFALLPGLEGVPAAPFANTWDELVLKRMLRWAAENGYDGIAWTTGAQQADRYNLSKVVDWISSVRTREGTYRIEGLRQGGHSVFDQILTEGKLADAVGKDLARKIIDSGPGAQRWTGPDLTVGGQGMKGFYDQILPYSAKKVTKKWGGEVGKITIPTGQKISAMKPLYAPKVEEVHHLPIAPQMRDAILGEGLPLFQTRKGAIEFLDDGKAIITAFEQADTSTVIHELGHPLWKQLDNMDAGRVKGWMQVEAERLNGLAEKGELPGAVANRLFVDNVGNRVERLDPFTGDDLSRAGHEMFATAFERYFSEGIAPTEDLRDVFEFLKQVLLKVYHAIAGSDIDVNINDTVRGVFDRALAADPEILRRQDPAAASAIGRLEYDAWRTEGAALGRVPLGLDDADHLWGTGGDYEALAARLDTLRQEAEATSDPHNLDRLASKWAHSGEKKPIQAFGKTVYSDRIHSVAAQREYRKTLIPTEFQGNARAYYKRQKDLALWYMDLAEEARARLVGTDVAPAGTLPKWAAEESMAAMERAQELEQGAGPRVVGQAAPDTTQYARPAAGMEGPTWTPPLYQRGKKAPGQMGMFPSGEDLPLFSGTAQRGEVGRFAPPEVGRKEFLPGMEPTFDELAEAQAAKKAKAAEDLRPRKVPEGQQTLWQQVDPTTTPSFRKWFGESKAVDADGRPVVAYHGTVGEFEQFDPARMGTRTDKGYYGRGFYFSDAPWYAGNYAGDVMGEGGAMMPVYLKIENPLVIDWSLPSAKVPRSLLPYLPDKMTTFGGREFPTEWISMQDFVSISRKDPKAFAEVVQKAGHDGIIVRFQDSTSAEYVAFDPAQIKSAIANSGDFDIYDPSILHQETARSLANGGVAEYGAAEPPKMADLVESTAQATRQGLDDIKAGMAQDWGKWQPQLADQAVQQQATDWLNNEVMPEWWGTRAAGLQYAKKMADEAQLDYSQFRRFDMGLSHLVPYHYWYTRSGMNWARRFATQPGMLKNYVKTRMAMKQANENAGRRQRFGERVGIPFPWLPDWMGDKLFVDPFSWALPFANLYGTKWDDSDEARTGLQALYANLEKFGMRPYHYLDYPYKAGLLQKAGEAVGMAPEKAQEMLGPEIEGDFGFLLPQSRLLRSATAGTELGGPAGLNIESGVRGVLGLPAGEVWDPYRVNRMIANMSAERPQDRNLAIAALNAQALVDADTDQRGRVWAPDSELAQQVAAEQNWTPQELAAAQALLSTALTRAAQEQGIGSIGWLTGPRTSIEPAGERAQLEMAEQARETTWAPPGYGPGTPTGSREDYQQFKEDYPAMYPRATQYATMPGEQQFEGMEPGARANWMQKSQAEDTIYESFGQQMDSLLRQRPWDSKALSTIRSQRQAALEAVEARYPIPEMTGEIPAVLYGMNPQEMGDALVEKELRAAQSRKPQADAFAEGEEIDWSAYYDAVDAWRATLPKTSAALKQAGGLGSRYAGLSFAQAVDAFENQHDSPLIAAHEMYRQLVSNPAWDRYNALAGQLNERFPGYDALQDKYFTLPQGQARRDFLAQNPQLKAYWDYKSATGSAYAQTVGAVGRVDATDLIPAILDKYRLQGWTAEQLQQELAGVVFPAISQQQETQGAGAGAGASYAGAGAGTGYAAQPSTGDWRKDVGRPWWERYGRGLHPTGGRSGGGGGGGSGSRWTPRWTPRRYMYGGPYRG